MTKYQVIISPTAKKNLADISYYISEILKSPVAAINLEIELTDAMLSLEENPYRAPYFSENFRLTPMEEVRKLVNGRYLILFYVDETKHQVNIVTVYNHLQDEV